MNRDDKAAVIDEIAASITESQAIFAVDYRGITVEQAKDLRTKLRASDATLRVVKNSLTERAADKAGVEQLKTLLAGPTALTFVRGDSAAAAKSLADFARTTQLLAFKGGLMDGSAVSAAEITAISRLPVREVLYGQLVGLVANPITSLARTLNALIGGLAIGLSGVLEQKQADAPAAVEAAVAADPPAESAPSEEAPPADAPESEVAQAPPESAPAEEAPPADAPESEVAQAPPDSAPGEEAPPADAPESEVAQAPPDAEAPTELPPDAPLSEESPPEASAPQADDSPPSESPTNTEQETTT
jgi:large subunit ribosomal protein L10